MSQFKIHTIESAPEAAQEALKAVQNANGFIPKFNRCSCECPYCT